MAHPFQKPMNRRQVLRLSLAGFLVSFPDTSLFSLANASETEATTEATKTSAKIPLPEKLPDWVEAKIDEALPRFHQWCGTDTTLVFPLMTDLHACAPEIQVPAEFTDPKFCVLYAQRVATRFQADFLGDLGDIELDRNTRWQPATVAEMKQRFASQVRLYEDFTLPVLFSMGNHDHGNAQHASEFRVSSKMYGEQFNGLTRRHGHTLTTGPNSDYGFFDIPAKRCRAFFLNTSEELVPYAYYGFSPAQLQFLADHLRMPEGWTAVVLMHFCTHPTIGQWTSYPNTKARHQETFNQILADFVAKKRGTQNDVHWDFTDTPQTTLAGCFCGDSHWDNQDTLDGVSYTITQGYGTVSGKEIQNGAMVTPFSYQNEMLFDVVAVKPSKREVHLFRVGAGGAARDREFTY